MNTKKNWLNEFERHKIKLCLRERFFGMLLSSLKPVICDNVNGHAIDTMAVDGKNIYINPDFAESLTGKEFRGVLMHEALHCGLLHFARLGNRDARLANIAQDYAINNELDTYLANSDIACLPKGGLINHKFDGKGFEEIYSILEKENPPQKKKQGQGNESGKGKGQGEGNGDVIYSKGQESKELEKTWKNLATQAAQVCKAQGKLPGSFAEMVGELITPKIDFKEYFFNFVSSKIKQDYSWAIPDSRLLSLGYHFPTLQGEQLGPIALAIDTSGSVGQQEFREFLGVAQSILNDCRPEKLVFIQCDTQVHEVREFEPDDSLEGLTLKGRGGTDFRPVFETLKKYDNLECLVFLTDLYGTFPETAPAYRTLWITDTKNYKAPFGETVTL